MGGTPGSANGAKAATRSRTPIPGAGGKGRIPRPAPLGGADHQHLGGASRTELIATDLPGSDISADPRFRNGRSLKIGVGGNISFLKGGTPQTSGIVDQVAATSVDADQHPRQISQYWYCIDRRQPCLPRWHRLRHFGIHAGNLAAGLTTVSLAEQCHRA